jgi:two-component system cell cycle sensor histidine kinase/response regulator CckA
MLSLVVDDDATIRAFVRSILESEGFQTLEAENGAEALGMVRMLDGSVDLIVTDIEMPGGSGLELSDGVRARFPSVRIIVMSGYPEPAVRFDFVPKPFSWADMRSALRRVLAT